MPHNLSVFLKAAAVWFLLGIIFLVPVLALPWTYDPFEMHKQAVLVMGSLFAVLCWLSSRLGEGELTWHKPRSVWLALLLFLTLTAISATLSFSPAISWLGFGAQEYMSVLSLVAFLLVFGLVRGLSVDAGNKAKIITAVLAGAALVGALSLPAFMGINLGIFNNPIGTPHALGVYLIVVSLFGLSLWLFQGQQTKVRGFLTALITISGLLTLLALDSLLLWCLLMAGVITTFVMAFWHAEDFPRPGHFLPHMLLFVLAAAGAFLPIRFPSPFLQEVSPNAATTWGIVQGAWHDGSVMFGTGPGTFSFDYAKHVSVDVNQSDFWNITFDRGNAYLTTLLATHGISGALAFIFFFVLIAALSIRQLHKGEDRFRLIAPIFVAWLMMAIAMFVYAQTMALSLVFWVLSGLLVGAVAPAEVRVLRPTQARFVLLGSSILILVACLGSMYVFSARYSSQIAFAKALKLDPTREIDEVVRLFDKAAATDLWDDAYERNLAGALVRKISLLSNEELADSEYVQALIEAAIAMANQATVASPNNVLAWEVKGLVYRELLSVVPDGAEPSVRAYERAIDLAPVNPYYRVEAARAYLAWADSQSPLTASPDEGTAALASETKTEALLQAEEHLRVALALKGDYAQAQYYFALLQERQGKLAEAVRGLEAVRAQAPDDLGVGLQLAQLYLRQGKNDLAEAELHRLLEIAPAYANAHWYLSVVYEQRGDITRAIEEIEIILANDPGNVIAQNRLSRLQQGQISETIPEPIMETP
jgi:tetratricopeptide (TPR) repeat protein